MRHGAPAQAIPLLRCRARLWARHAPALAVELLVNAALAVTGLIFAHSLAQTAGIAATAAPSGIAAGRTSALSPAAIYTCWGGGELILALYNLGFAGIARLGPLAREGGFERMLCRPAPLLLQLIVEGATPAALPSALAGAACLLYGLNGLPAGAAPDPLLWPLLPIQIAAGVVALAGAVLAASSLALWMPLRAGPGALILQVALLGRWPAEAFPLPWRWLLLPVTAAGWLPVSLFLPGAPLGLLTVPLAAISAWIGASALRYGLRRYGG